MNLVATVIASRSLLDFMPADVRLIPTGKDAYRARCPLGHETGNSFAIRRHARGHLVFKCFSCNASGTVIDLYASLNKVPISVAIKRLADGCERMTPEAEMQRAYDFMIAGQGRYVLVCEAPRCEVKRELDTELDAALAVVSAGHASGWFVAPDGIGALCPRHA